ncbi:hypothetical protein CK203_101114 [Vitis vinifera]|uniref:Retrotransposon gag domain-containing protein n=1 Tax=Vitis vinifera TaxID=29760 RepID=A0A438C628_VITVI|nr:hypothetical protein CK203_101114 [Vitis vinifera]
MVMEGSDAVGAIDGIVGVIEGVVETPQAWALVVLNKSNCEDVFPENEWLGFLFLRVKEARFINFVDYSRLRTEIRVHRLIEHQSIGHTPASHHGQQDNPNAFISMRDRMYPPRMSAPSCIVPPTEQGPMALKRQISNFSAKENEKFYECWERYMEAINACPHHGFDTWLLVSYFYDGMFSSMKQLLETMCGGDFMSKNPKEAMDFLNYVAEVSRGWNELNREEVEKMKS